MSRNSWLAADVARLTWHGRRHQRNAFPPTLTVPPAPSSAGGLYEELSLLAQQSEAFGLARDEVGLGGVDPDRDLL